MQSLVLDFDKLAEIGLKGVRRSAVFMGLGLNAAHDPAFKNYQLSNIQNIAAKAKAIRMELIPSNVNDETLTHFKGEFGIWVIANGLREVIESFAVFLDGVHYACQWIALKNQKLQPSDAEKRDKTFRHKGIKDKLNDLEIRFGIKSNHPQYLVSITQARHCLTHRLGRVGVEDCEGDGLEVKWLGMEFQIELESGKVLTADEAFGFVLPEPGTFQIKFVERCKRFPLGSFARFEMHELAEICNFMLDSIRAVTTRQSSMQKTPEYKYSRSRKLVLKPD
jgi:hypothetical protein